MSYKNVIARPSSIPYSYSTIKKDPLFYLFESPLVDEINIISYLYPCLFYLAFVFISY